MTNRESKPAIAYCDENRYDAAQDKQSGRLKNVVRERGKKKIKDRDLVSNRSVKNIKRGGQAEGDKNVIVRHDQRISNRDGYLNHDRVKMGKQAREIESHNNLSAVAFRVEQTDLEEEDCAESMSLMSDLSEDHCQPTKGAPTTKHLITGQSLNSRIKSMHSILGANESSSSHPHGLLRCPNKRGSVAYLADSLQYKVVARLNASKHFAQAYRENRHLMDENREAFVDQLISRRSFCGRQKVEFANFKGAEEAGKKAREVYRGKESGWRQERREEP